MIGGTAALPRPLRSPHTPPSVLSSFCFLTSSMDSMEVCMTRHAIVFLGLLAVATSVFAQSPGIDTPLLAAPANQRDGATVIKWKPDFTYETLRKGTNRLVCYDRSG